MSTGYDQDRTIDLRTPPVTVTTTAERELDGEQPTLGELLGDLTHDVSELMSTQLQLAVVEIKDEMRQAARGGAMVGAAGLLGYLALALGAFTLAFGLAEWLELWAAFLIVTLLVAAIAAALFFSGRSTIQATDPLPRQTIKTLQEDRQWLRQQMS
jgi:uncharacterized membrane protein YqjE